MLMDLLLKPFEWTLNKLCASDECFFPRLKPYKNKVIRMTSLDGLCQCDCVIQADHLYFYGDSNRQPDVTLKLSPMFIKDWLMDPKNPLVFFTSAYEIQGDMALAEALKEVFSRLEIDVEEHLSRVVGDPIANNLCYAGEQINQWAHDTHRQMKVDVRDYLQEESGLLVPSLLVEEYISATQTLRDDVDRLEARVNRLLKHWEATCGE